MRAALGRAFWRKPSIDPEKMLELAPVSHRTVIKSDPEQSIVALARAHRTSLQVAGLLGQVSSVLLSRYGDTTLSW